jgi:hypothetical protein
MQTLALMNVFRVYLVARQLSVAFLQGVVSREASLESVLDDLVGKVTMSDWLLPFSKITT